MEQTIHSESPQYELLNLLGEGLSSRVFKALRFDSRGHSQQTVVVKFLKDPSTVSWLQREFQTLEKLRSPYCVGINGWENFKEGPALILEYIEGVSLESLLLSQPLSKPLVTEIVFQIQEGLKALHDSGLIHGDLSPRNVMVDVHGNVKLIDFGAAFSSREKVLGTPDYLDPQVVKTGLKTIDSDLYALGLIWKEMLAKTKSPLPQFFLGPERFLRRHRSFLNLRQHPALRSEIGKIVSQMLYAGKGTEVLLVESTLGVEVKKLAFGKRLAASLALMFLPVFSLTHSQYEPYARLEVASLRWYQISINGVDGGYTPVKASLQSGKHFIKWVSADKKGEFSIYLQPGENRQLLEQDLLQMSKSTLKR